VGRDDELALLRTALAEAGKARGGAVFVVGEPGFGKTRLVRELARTATAAVVFGRATSPSVQFRPLAEALFSALRHVGVPDDPELAPYRPALSRLVPEWRVRRVPGVDDSLVVLAEGVLRLLRRLGQDTGCLVVIDDLHDADPDTLEVVDYLVDNLAGEPVLFVGTVRPDPGPAAELVRAARRRGVASVVELSRLDDDEVRLMVARWLNVRSMSLPDSVVDRVLAAGEGNPFYVEELLATTREGHLNGLAPAGVLASVVVPLLVQGPAGVA
ncbi:AAA family ATPase, partial [Kibdelosporangium lantanae]